VRRVVAAASLAVALGLACAAKKAATPDAAAPAEGAAAPEMPGDIDSLEQELARYEAQLDIEGALRDKARLEAEDAGGQVDTAGEGTPSGVGQGNCGRICELTESICELEGRICSLASEHEGETRYADACERAGRDCARGREACNACCG
jgi:hypothetical protein